MKQESDLPQYLKETNKQSFFINTSETSEILSEIKPLKSSKSSGPLGIPVKILKLFPDAFTEPINLITNLSFLTGSFPSTIKQANVIAVFKNDDHTLYNNYRPISLLSNITKVIGKLMHKRLMQFLNLTKQFYDK